MKVTFIGSSTCIPDKKYETASFVVNGEHLFDTGWNAVYKMREYGIEPLAIKSVILTAVYEVNC